MDIGKQQEKATAELVKFRFSPHQQEVFCTRIGWLDECGYWYHKVAIMVGECENLFIAALYTTVDIVAVQTRCQPMAAGRELCL